MLRAGFPLQTLDHAGDRFRGSRLLEYFLALLNSVDIRRLFIEAVYEILFTSCWSRRREMWQDKTMQSQR